MASHLHIDLDQLKSSAKFEELCAAILAKYFCSNIIPYGALGPDGGIDSRLNGLPSSYASFEGSPTLYKKSKTLKNGFWVFQSKFHYMPYNTGKTVLTSLNLELKKWQTRNPQADYFILLTNIVVSPTAHKVLQKFQKKPPKPFKFFDYWDGAKLSAYVAGDSSIRSTFFPNYEDKLDDVLSQVRQTQKLLPVGKAPKTQNRKNAKPKRSKIAKPKSRKLSYDTAIRQLVRFEANFTDLNNALVKKLLPPPEDLSKDWPVLKILAKKTGIIQLSQSVEPVLLSLIKANNAGAVYIRLWNNYIGESVVKGEQILELVYNPSDQAVVNLIQNDLFEIVSGKNAIHESVDKRIKTIGDRIIREIRESQISKVEEDLRELHNLKKDYLEAKVNLGEGFYPNTRRIGHLTFGWDFQKIWDEAFDRIIDIALAQTQPDSVYSLLASIPESISKTVLHEKGALERISSELNTFSDLIWKSQKRSNSDLLALATSSLESLYDSFSDIGFRIKSVEEAEWTLNAAKVFADFVGSFGKSCIQGKLSLDLSYFEQLLHKCTSLSLSTTASLRDDLGSYSRLGQIDLLLQEVASEYRFAWGTYAWFRTRKNNSKLGKLAVSQLGRISTGEIVRFYSKQNGLRGWFSFWFHPEGQRGAWSSRIDHDIRNSLLLSLLTRKVSSTDLMGLEFLENDSAVNEFLKDLKVESELAEEHSIRLESNTKEIELEIRAAQKKAREVRENKLRQQIELDATKLKEVQESFTKALRLHNPAGFLYSIKEYSSVEKVFQVGTYTIQDKEWFVNIPGYSYFSVHGLGSGWAENILHGRESLLMEQLKSHLKPSSVDVSAFDEILRILASYDDQYILVAHFSAFPWQLKGSQFTYQSMLQLHDRPFYPGQHMRLKNLDVYTSRHMPEGTFAVIRRELFTWKTDMICAGPKISIIHPESEDARRISSKYPEMDISLKVVVDARETGKMESNSLFLSEIKSWKIVAGKSAKSR